MTNNYVPLSLPSMTLSTWKFVLKRQSLLLFSICFVACSTSHTGVSQHHTDATLQWLRQHYGFVESQTATNYFSEASTRFEQAIPAATKLCRDAVQTPWSPNLLFTFVLFLDSQPNAFSLGSQTIAVSTGMFHLLESESQLYAVLSHEVAHDLLQHSSPTDGQTPHDGDAPRTYFMKEQELEADSMSLCILSALGYSSDAAVESLRKGYRQFTENVSLTAFFDTRMTNLATMARNIPSHPNHHSFSRRFARLRRELLKRQ